ncbi:MAG: TonB-dependent receptor [Saprospiraceae bacterium]
MKQLFTKPLKFKYLIWIILSASVNARSYAQSNPAIINATVHGKLVEAKTGEPIPGASIQIKGTTHGVVTDINGFFYFQTGQKLPFTVIITSIGFKGQEVIVNQDSATISLEEDISLLNEIMVTARRRRETAHDIPIPLSVIGGAQVEDAGAFNVNRVIELVPSVQLYSSNPRNTTLNIRGLGSTFGLTNDGIDPGVGFYIDGVYYARPAATALDFIDIEQIEVLRGPQGTLFGKNTSAGAFNITTKAASFDPGATLELSYGNYGYIQAKTSLTGSISRKFAGRISLSGTQRDGLLYNVATQQHVNDINNLGFRGQLLFVPNNKTKITLVTDATNQNPNGYAQVIAGVAPTKRPAYRQFNQIIKDLNYTLPSQNPFDRLIDHDTPWRSGNKLGGASINLDAKLGSGTLTATTAWRYWKWDPSNDRDFTGLPVLSKSAGTSRHEQWSQEVRYAGDFSSRLSGVIGLFALGQVVQSDPVQTEESGAAQWRFSQSSTSALWKTPGLFDGFGIKTKSKLNTLSGALFGQLDWLIVPKLRVLPGIRYNLDQKKENYSRQTYGGLQTTDPALLALKNAVYTNQKFDLKANENNFSGQLTVAYEPSRSINSFVTLATNFKPVGVNLGGLPTANGVVLLDLARVKPEYVKYFETGIKTNPTDNTTLNLVFHNTNIDDFQTQVQTAEVGVNRGYLANAEKVRVQGLELDASIKVRNSFSLNGAFTYTDGKYISFKNAPVPLEETGGESAFKDISGSQLPGISKWAGSLGGDVSKEGKLFKHDGRFFIALDNYYRSSFSSSPSPSQYLNINGYILVNARAGFRATKGVSAFIWTRNALDKNYFEQLLPAAGNAGQYAGVLGDQRTIGVTIRYVY